MTGERSTALYIQALQGSIPEFNDEEEKEYYYKIKSEIEAAEKKYGRKLEWIIPDD